MKQITVNYRKYSCSILKNHCILKMCLIVLKIMPQCHKFPLAKYNFLFFISLFSSDMFFLIIIMFLFKTNSTKISRNTGVIKNTINTSEIQPDRLKWSQMYRIVMFPVITNLYSSHGLCPSLQVDVYRVLQSLQYLDEPVRAEAGREEADVQDGSAETHSCKRNTL